MMSDENFREIEALKLVKKYGLVKSCQWPGRYTFNDINANVAGFPIGLNIWGSVAFATNCILDRYNTISFESWNLNVRIEDFENYLLKLKKEYEECKLKQKENIVRKKLEEIQEDFV